MLGKFQISNSKSQKKSQIPNPKSQKKDLGFWYLDFGYLDFLMNHFSRPEQLKFNFNKKIFGSYTKRVLYLHR